ncbi:MAG: S24 family peptidase [Eubacteriales bacterium]|nr:S24 family peptidase [Eubacteriales bacterium]
MIGSTLRQLLQERGMSVSEAARQAGVPIQTLHSIIRRDNMRIDLDLLLRLCDLLEVDLLSFVYGPGEENPSLPNAEERAMLRRYRELDSHGHRLVNLVMEAESLRLRGEAEEEKKRTKIIPLFNTPAAAGYASPALGEDYVDYEIPFTSEADFAARIDGDSMEPYIHDGEIVLAVRRTDLRDGDVGLFFVDGDMKCKQFCQDSEGNMYLFSLNRDRSDADVTISADSGVTVCCFGRVLMDRLIPLP